MIIKKFVASNSRTAMAQVLKAFGPDAIVLSSKAVGDQFEMIAAPKYEEKDVESELTILNAEQQKKVEQTDSTIRVLEQKTRDQTESLTILQNEMTKIRDLLEEEIKQNRALTQKNLSLELSQQRHREADVHQLIEQQLTEIGISKQLRESLKRRLKGIQQAEVASHKTVQILSTAVNELPLSSFPDQGKAFFMGPKGAGKTSALINLAQQHRKIYGTEGMVLISYGPAAQGDLLWKYATSLGIEYRQIDTPRKLVSVMKELSSKALMLIDIQSSVKTADPVFALLEDSAIQTSSFYKFLVVAANSEKTEQERTIERYRSVRPAVIVSKADRPRFLGSLVELLIRKKSPLAFVTETRQLKGAIAPGDSEQLIRRALDLQKIPEVADVFSPDNTASGLNMNRMAG